MYATFPQLFDADAEGKVFAVRHSRQSEVEDHFAVLNKETGEIVYEKFPRSMEQTAENVLGYYE